MKTLAHGVLFSNQATAIARFGECIPEALVTSAFRIPVRWPIDRFHSRDQQPYWFNETKKVFALK